LNALQSRAFSTYQDVALLYGCHVKTVSRWVKRLGLRTFAPTARSVRIPADTLPLLLAAVGSRRAPRNWRAQDELQGRLPL
jgi:hypothetical protein